MNVIRNIRKNVFRMRQVEFAELLSTSARTVSQAQVSNWEKNESLPDWAKLRVREQANALGLRWEDSWFFEPPPIDINDALTDDVVADAACVAAAAYAFDVLQADVRSRGRREPVALARQVAMYLFHCEFGMTMTASGGAHGRHRATVNHASAKIEEAREDPLVDAFIDTVKQAARLLDQARRLRQQVQW